MSRLAPRTKLKRGPCPQAQNSLSEYASLTAGPARGGRRDRSDLDPRPHPGQVVTMAINPKVVQMARAFAADPQLAFDFYCAASAIVDDFEEWGPVLQANEGGEYDDTAAIVRLRAIRAEILGHLER